MVLAAGVAAYGVACLVSERIPAGAGGALGRHARHVHGPSAFRAGRVRRARGRHAVPPTARRYLPDAHQHRVRGRCSGSWWSKSASSFFGISAFNQSSITKALNDASAQSGEGGSKFTPVVVNSPVKFPLGRRHGAVPAAPVRGPLPPGDAHRARRYRARRPDDSIACARSGARCGSGAAFRTSSTAWARSSCSSSRSRASRTSASSPASERSSNRCSWCSSRSRRTFRSSATSPRPAIGRARRPTPCGAYARDRP